MECIDQTLVTGIGVNGRHESILDSECVIEDLGQDGKTIRGAGRVRNDEVPLRVELLFIHPDHQGCVGVWRWSRDHDSGCARFEVS